MASVTFSTPNNIEYGNGQVLISLDDASVDDFTVYDVYIGSSNSWEWTFDVGEYLENNSGGQTGLDPNLTVDTPLNGDYTFTFNGCTFTVDIKDLPTFNGNQCIDNCVTYSFQNYNNNVPVTFYYTDCYTGDVVEDMVDVNDKKDVCACEGEYYDPSGTLTVNQDGVCFVCDYTTWVVGDAIDGQNVIDNVTLYYGGLELTPNGSQPPTFQMGTTSYDLTYIVPPGYQNTGQECGIKIEDITVEEDSTTDCICREVTVTNITNQGIVEGRPVRYTYVDCDGVEYTDEIPPGENITVCMCGVPQNTSSLNFNDNGDCRRRE